MDKSSLFPDYHDYDRRERPVTAMAKDFPSGYRTGPHQHPSGQLVYALHGVVVAHTEMGRWVVPPTRALWMPPSIRHELRMVGAVRMRTAYIHAEASRQLPPHCSVMAISPLLRELILAAIDIHGPYGDDTRDGRVMRLLLDELRQLPTLPLRLPRPADPRLQAVCEAIVATPDDKTTAQGWAGRLGVDAKTVHRLFVRETGMTFGQWRQQARLLAALERLAEGAKILDVALELGYASPSAFSTMFKRQFGVAPSAFFDQ
ncbi:helix-turn-helix transcriptional regulator [Pigmentiphaga sp.]|uniref:AraC family transcriptional regulator n=1 Tax=Pigmentiphaga sp. TaxID=1977564 RepID=UPI00128B442F|nr:helix-turn-helix transcriptional regulator [Pigmentiphaga sp.]MPS25739.1 AraC family transcriptional regulator [Alcaligenaceae bacterium SAGV5]MPS54443.1 AraC family transcriptional regulator [Alcaligenaceae bacterium SAGV3]MPT58583.1 AraC family transcriptional regulator [Alcaligenaceae bacterium]